MKQPKVYVKKYNKVFDVIEIHFDIDVVCFDDGQPDFAQFDFEDVKFIYNTGYKDKNGNYIYTGDIVEHNNLRYIANKKTEEEFYYLTRGRHRCALSSMEDDYLVIGNIYENKELLEVR